MTIPVRGRIYWADLGYGKKPWLCVSNNARNQKLESCLVARITTSSKPALESIVALGADDPLAGSVLCDDVTPLFRDEIDGDAGALSHRTMMRVDLGLRAALALM